MTVTEKLARFIIEANLEKVPLRNGGSQLACGHLKKVSSGL